jgi:hypothetical protein
MAAEADRVAGSAATCDIWLRGNVRPAAGLLIGAVLLAAGIAAAIILVPIASSAAWTLGITAGLLVVAAALLAWSAARPRLVRTGPAVLVRLSPLAAHRVPLDIVECAFPGSQSLAHDRSPPADAAAVADRRVNTLVLRLAERATDWRAKPVAAAWGSWSEGTIVFDGRWCEPLSPEVVRGIAARLIEAKRELTGGAER